MLTSRRSNISHGQAKLSIVMTALWRLVIHAPSTLATDYAHCFEDTLVLDIEPPSALSAQQLIDI